jgi:UDPglucose 6-dehydrogenase
MTDDMREAPSQVIIHELIQRGAKIQAYDPEAMKEAKRIFVNNPNITYFDDQYSALKDANALLIVTEWRQFRMPDFEKINSLLKEKVIFDGRNQYEPDQMKELGYTYYCIGRPGK